MIGFGCRHRWLAALRSVTPVVALVAVMFVSAFGASHHAIAAEAFPLGGDATVDTDLLNIRSTAGLDGVVTAVVPLGTLLAINAGPVTSDGHDWYQITRLDVVRTGEGGADGWVAGEFLKSSGFAPGTRLHVTDGPVNLRAGASTETAKLDSLAQGTAMTVSTGPLPAGGHSWYQVVVDNGDEGWVAGEFLGEISGGGNPSGGYQAGDAVIVVDGPLNLRESPGLTGAISRVVPTGATFSTAADAVDADGHTWISVISVGYGHGWVASEFIALDPAGTGGGEQNGPGA